ncbi:VOC family protein, partial [Vibrio parahaemolyticus]|nr:glyoxalase/bleomycin resistance/dioxygenase family protein [Vibrio parahaemolyticus]
LSRFEAIGASLYRGPMEIENGLSMCQLEDPFGNLIGLRGATT